MGLGYCRKCGVTDNPVRRGVCSECYGQDLPDIEVLDYDDDWSENHD